MIHLSDINFHMMTADSEFITLLPFLASNTLNMAKWLLFNLWKDDIKHERARRKIEKEQKGIQNDTFSGYKLSN